MKNLIVIFIAAFAFSTTFAQTPATQEGRRRNAPAPAATTAPATNPATATTAAADTSKPKIQERKKKAAQPEVVQRQMKTKEGKSTAQEFRRRQPDAYRCNAPLYERDFQYAFAGLSDNRRGNQDYNITQFVHRNCLTVDQIARLGGLYRDDADRLLFVFDAFSYCYDYDSYDLLITLFQQGTHITKFNDFIYDNLYEPANGGYYGYNNNGYYWYGAQQTGYNDGWNNYNNNGYNNNNGGYNPPRNDPYFNPNAGAFPDNGYNGGGNGGQNGGGGRGGNGGGNGGHNGGGHGGHNGGGNGGYNGGGNGGGNGGYNNYAPQAMGSRDFSDAVASIQNNSFEDTRLQIAKQVASSNFLSTGQISEICRLFSFDDRRLDFAKFAYSRCIDPQNYYKVGDVMTFNSNKSALSTFVTNNPPVANNNNYNNNNNNYNNNNDNNYDNYQNTGGYNGGGNGNGNGGNGGGQSNVVVTVDSREFQSISNNIRSQSIESNKLQVAKQICETRYFTANQIAELARLFTIESYKFDFAKFAYARCADSQNYYVVNAVFNVQSYVRDLSEFVRRGGR
jgi:Domain of unknown function (DUF4476)